MSLRRSMLAGCCWVFVAMLAAGCASIGAGSRSAEEIVLERAQARWNALVARNWKTAYSFLTPAYRAIVPLERYANQFSGPAQWEGAKATGAKCEEARCTVSVEIAFRLLLPGHAKRQSSTFVDEVWVLEDGQWYKFETP